MPEFPEGSEWSQIKAELNYIFTHSRKVTLSKTKNKQKSPTFIAKPFGQKNFSAALLALERTSDCPNAPETPRNHRSPTARERKQWPQTQCRKLFQRSNQRLPEGKGFNANGREPPQLWDCEELNHSYWGYRRKRAKEGGGFWQSSSFSLHTGSLHSARHRQTVEFLLAALLQPKLPSLSRF